jgi:hypothetical protein
MVRHRALGVLLAAFALSASVANAAEPSPKPVAQPSGDAALTDKVDAAIAGATSYRIAVTGPGGLLLDIREFGPERVKIASTTPSGSTESIVVGTAMYYRAANGDWKAYPVPPIRRVRKNRLYMGAPETLLEPLPDRTQGSETVGAFRSAAVGNAQVPGIMECTYDKATYRPRACNVTLQGLPSAVQVTYASWDDPSNAVEAPSGVAPPVRPSPLPSPVPTRTPS